MANTYGFDFLKAQHTLGGSDAPRPALATDEPKDDAIGTPLVTAEDVAHKPALEKQADILKFLKAHRSAGYLGPSTIYKGTGIDLEEADEDVARLLKDNPKVQITLVQHPENPQELLATYAYKSKYQHVRDRATLLAEVNRAKYCLDVKDLLDSYDGVEDDIQALLTAGDVIGVANTEDKTTILFPRGGTFLVEMDGIITLPPGTHEQRPGSPVASSLLATTPTANLTDDQVVRAALERNRKLSMEDIYCVDTDVNPQNQIRRGEAISVGGQWYRVSSAVRHGLSLSDQPARAQAPLSVTSLDDLSKRNEIDGYIRSFNHKNIPLDGPLTEDAKQNLTKSKEARNKLHQLAGGKSHSGGAAQLLSSHAHASNPTTLAANFATTMVGRGGGRKRPTAHKQSSASVQQTRKDAQAAQEAASDPNLSLYSHARRHGCTKDVRSLYFSTRELVPSDESEQYKLLIKHKLLGEGEAWRRPKLPKRTNVDNDGKPKKRRYYERKNQRMTNTHLLGTAIGAVLADAAERQQQGKSVGDGGM